MEYGLGGGLSAPPTKNNNIMASPYATQQTRKAGGNEPWRNKERHYCALCNAWMGSDRQSISLHENGKKHIEAVENDLARRRDEKARREKDRKDLESVFAKVNAAAGCGAAAAAAAAAAPSFGSTKPWDYPPPPHGVLSSRPGTAAQGGVPSPAQQPMTKRDSRAPREADEITSKEIRAKTASNKPAFDPNVGHYDVEGTTYLEGQIYAIVLEEGMPIQLWMGSTLATDAERRDLRNTNNWKMALLAKVVRKGGGGGNVSCHVSYLQKSTDDDETLESNVPPSRIRLVLGSDPSIPSTMEEAHLALMGGEQTIHVSNDTTAIVAEIDENTGLSGWTTTTIRKVSSQYEANQEKKRKREHEKELAEYKDKKEREIQARKMEEAKYANAHDSALGAYDVWSSSSTSAVEGKTRAYKGVDITKETKVEVSETAKSLSKGMGNVAFKKKSLTKKKNARITSADDD